MNDSREPEVIEAPNFHFPANLNQKLYLAGIVMGIASVTLTTSPETMVAGRLAGLAAAACLLAIPYNLLGD